MKIITYLKDAYELLDSSVVALGNFDGVHKGHQYLIEHAVKLANNQGIHSVVFTFTNHPLNYISGENIVKNIQSFEEKLSSIETLGVDYVVALPFDEGMMKMTAERFAKHILSSALKCRIAVCGFNYTFGAGGAGKADNLMQLGEKYGFETVILPEYDIDGKLVSSSNIRLFIQEGRMEDFELFTGRKYAINGTVIHGNHIGTGIGFPTANLNLDSSMVLPLNGVYLTNIYVNNSEYKGVTNVGNKPTIGVYNKNAETHIFDFEGDLYGETIKIEFVKMLREERKFDSVDLLRKQIKKDCAEAKKYC